MAVHKKNNATMYGNTGGIRSIVSNSNYENDSAKTLETQAVCGWIKLGDVLPDLANVKGGRYE